MVNLWRKLFHSEYLRQSRTDEILRVLEEVDKHSAAIALNIYCCQSPRRDAEFGLALWKGIFGKPVEWPSVAQIRDRAAKIGPLLAFHESVLQEEATQADINLLQIVPYEEPSDEEDFVPRLSIADLIAPKPNEKKRCRAEDTAPAPHNSMAYLRKIPTKIEPDQQIWMLGQHTDDETMPAGVVPSLTWCQDALERGKLEADFTSQTAAGVLTALHFVLKGLLQRVRRH